MFLLSNNQLDLKINNFWGVALPITSSYLECNNIKKKRVKEDNFYATAEYHAYPSYQAFQPCQGNMNSGRQFKNSINWTESIFLCALLS